MQKSFTLSMIMSLCLLVFTLVAIAQDVVTIKGVVKSVDLKMKSFIIKTYDGKDVTITIDDGALKKFEKGVIKEDDDVTVKCIVKDEQIISVSFFRKPRG